MSPPLAPDIRRILDHALFRKRLDLIEQTLILALSAAAIAIIDHGPHAWKFWGNAIGLCAQPLWLHSTWRHRQWGMFALTFFYIGIWVTGLLRYA